MSRAYPYHRACAARLCLGLGALALAGCVALSQQTSREEVAGAERAFARDGIDLGIRAAFIAHFAPDGLVFQPGPVRVREAWPSLPAPADPRAFRLEWRPALVDVARAGDLALSTGPFRLVDTTGRQAESYGAFFSVWQRQADRTWKVWLDMGARSAREVGDDAFRSPPRPRAGPQDEATPTATAVSDLDRTLSGLAPADVAQRLAIDARTYREGSGVLVGEAWQQWLSATDTRADYTPSEARVSASGDFAASYGRIAHHARDGAPVNGYYVHVWVRDGGAWWLAVESIVDER
jgi:ketosteroid isomerase-like protein